MYQSLTSQERLDQQHIYEQIKTTINEMTARIMTINTIARHLRHLLLIEKTKDIILDEEYRQLSPEQQRGIQVAQLIKNTNIKKIVIETIKTQSSRIEIMADLLNDRDHFFDALIL